MKLQSVDFTLTTLRDRDGTGDPTWTDLAVINGTDCEISDSSLVNKGGGALSLAESERFYLLRNTLASGTTRVSPLASEPLSASEGAVGGDSIFYDMRHSAIVGNTRNILRNNQVHDFSYGLVYSGGGSSTLPSPLPTLGQDNVLENDTTTSVPTGIVIQSSYPGTLVRTSSCTSGCTTSVSDMSE